MGYLLKFIVLIIALWLVYRSIQKLTQGGHIKDNKPPTGKHPSGGEQMLPCAHCGVYIPSEQATRRGDSVYCCPEHRDADGA